MSDRVRVASANLKDQYNRTLRQWFDSQLSLIGLSEDQISEQDLAELEVSLEKINDAIENPDSFGKFRVKLGGERGIIISQTDDFHFEMGILPLLLERKGQILERIRALRPEQQLSEIRKDIASGVDDPSERERLIGVIDRRLQEQRESIEKLDQEKMQVEVAQAEALERQQRLKIEISERRSAIYKSFLERESVASMVGAISLLALGLTLIIAMFTHVTTSDVVANAFLLILGYFFGQATARDRDNNPASRQDS